MKKKTMKKIIMNLLERVEELEQIELTNQENFKNISESIDLTNGRITLLRAQYDRYKDNSGESCSLCQDDGK